MLGDIDVEVQSSDIEDYHPTGKPDKANYKEQWSVLQIENITKKYY